MYVKDDGHDYEIEIYNLLTKSKYQITKNSNDDSYPKIYENIIVWKSYDNNDWEIFLYDLSSKNKIQIILTMIIHH